MNRISLRDKNLIWAFNENYNIKIPENWQLDSPDFYEKLIISFCLGFKNSKLIFSYIEYLDKIDKDKSFSKIFFMYLENFFYEKSIKKRPALKYFKKEFFTNIRNFYLSHKRKDIVDELKYALSEKFFGNVPKTTTMVRKLAKTILESQKLNNEFELVENFEKIINTQFHFSIEDRKLKNGLGKFEIEKIKIDKDVLDDYYGLIGSAEFTTELDTENLEQPDLKESGSLNKSENNHNTIIKNIFGKSILSVKETLEIQNNICTKIHRDNKIIVSKGEYKDDIDSLFRKSQIEKSYLENKEYYAYFKNQFDREISNIQKIIKNSLFIESESHLKKTKYGNIDPTNVYRNIVLNDNKIFSKKIKLEKNNFSIDILIDASASQISRKESIASQSFIIASAFTNLSIPTRVMSFNNVENYLGLKIFREYDDEISKNDKIFEFHSMGSNRDGLALKLSSYLLGKNNYEKKLFIYLTDGKPNDVRQKTINKGEALDYTGKIAETDTAIEYRKLEQYGINTLAIFTGNDKDLESMQKIYGNNFVYIKNFKRFSKIVCEYIKKL